MNNGDWIQISILFLIVLVLIGLIYLIAAGQYLLFTIALIVCIASAYVISRRIKL